jgi:hypothetical protein
METNEIAGANGVSRASIPGGAITLELYAKNPFRVIGVRANATTAEIDRQFQRAQMIAEFDGGRKTGNGLLDPYPPPTADDLREARQKLIDPQRRIVSEFFWLWPVEPGDTGDPGLSAIAAGKVQEAINLWHNAAGAGSTVASHNLAVLFSLLALDLERARKSNPLSTAQTDLLARYWQTAIHHWCILFQSESLWSRLTARIKELDDAQLTEEFAGRFREALPGALIRIHTQLALKAAERNDNAELRRQKELITAYEQPSDVATQAFEELLIPFGERIKTHSATAASAISDPAHGLEAAKTLLAESQPVLRIFDSFLPVGNAKRDYANDDVALQCLNCGIAYMNKTDDWGSGIALLQSISPMIATEGARERLNANLNQALANQKAAVEAAEAAKRANACWYCSQRDKDAASTRRLKLFGEVRRSGNRTAWKVLPLDIPRCNSCKNKHLLASLITIPLAICLVAVPAYVAGAAALFILGAILSDSHLPGIVYFAIMAAGLGVVGAFFGALPRLLQRAHRKASSFVPLRGTKHEFDVTNFPALNNALRAGYQIGTRP